jgi:hypothetical protein
MTLRVNFLQIVCPIFVRSIDIDFAEKESIFTNKKYVCKQQNFYREQKKNILNMFLFHPLIRPKHICSRFVFISVVRY